ncbi:hypothetical protein CC80DRAFT_549339 [Byssothecium circinans]|uniref:MULE transposase domain-containing protein n=1 Tax=Byssothecium circinans TaxID=147558 RepID=A0A6A5U3C0_9PLEO|nr:hypothetical protein CC80DRAFT_549339 [Byssothecium circinans]
MPAKTQWAMYHCKYRPDFGIRVTSQVEGAHRDIKTCLSSSVGHLYDVVKAIHQFAITQWNTYNLKLGIAFATIRRKHQIPNFAALHYQVTPVALDLEQQLQLSDNASPL